MYQRTISGFHGRLSGELGFCAAYPTITPQKGTAKNSNFSLRLAILASHMSFKKALFKCLLMLFSSCQYLFPRSRHCKLSSYFFKQDINALIAVHHMIPLPSIQYPRVDSIAFDFLLYTLRPFHLIPNTLQ